MRSIHILLVLLVFMASAAAVQPYAPPARFIRDLARDGWDVIKVNRNNLFENGWIASGGDHVEHVVELARKARATGAASSSRLGNPMAARFPSKLPPRLTCYSA